MSGRVDGEGGVEIVVEDAELKKGYRGLGDCDGG
jgi:hypothetical protein